MKAFTERGTSFDSIVQRSKAHGILLIKICTLGNKIPHSNHFAT